MKLTTLSSIGLLSTAVLGFGNKEIDCNSGSVFIYGGKEEGEGGRLGLNLNLKEKLFHKDQSILNIDQTKLVLSDFIGTSEFEKVKNSEDAGIVEEIRSNYRIHNELLSKDQPESSIVIVVEDFPEGNKKELFGKAPAFKVEREGSVDDGKSHKGHDSKSTTDCDNSSFKFSSLFNHWVADVEKLYGKISELFTDNGYLLTNKKINGLTRREINIEGLDGSNKLENAVLKDIQSIRLLSEHLIGHHDKAFLEINSLTSLIGEDKYETAVEAIENALKDLINTSKTFKVAVVVSPSSKCFNDKQEEGKHHKHKQHGKHHDKHNSKHHHGKKHHHKHEKEKAPSTPSSTPQLLARDLPITPAKDVRVTYGATGFTNEQKCIESTNNCSGHGTCVKTNYNTYVCACKPSFDSTKKKTTNWAGNACQKKDVSVEFQLFFWTGLGIILSITWAISLLFSIGSQPLPGILSVSKKSI